ncbi:hypothetical protein [Thioalkalivibrio sp. HK1]|uniref:hypothetical protein n=1 Tax=Thioalkalivibrio sp. HK1 TaxID=1469245 RepID=UPI0012DC4E57|nr:hypothetical protein [Thioalkalivibrio sp. HK1]
MSIMKIRILHRAVNRLADGALHIGMVVATNLLLAMVFISHAEAFIGGLMRDAIEDALDPVPCGEQVTGWGSEVLSGAKEESDAFYPRVRICAEPEGIYGPLDPHINITCFAGKNRQSNFAYIVVIWTNDFIHDPMVSRAEGVEFDETIAWIRVGLENSVSLKGRWFSQDGNEGLNIYFHSKGDPITVNDEPWTAVNYYNDFLTLVEAILSEAEEYKGKAYATMNIVPDIESESNGYISVPLNGSYDHLKFLLDRCK